MTDLHAASRSTRSARVLHRWAGFVAALLLVALSIGPAIGANGQPGGLGEVRRAEVVRPTIKHRVDIAKVARSHRESTAERSTPARALRTRTDRSPRGVRSTTLALAPQPTAAPTAAASAAVPPTIATAFPGTDPWEALCPGCEPPDPWIAVNGSHVVHTVNSAVVVATRSGSRLARIPIAPFFALPETQAMQSADPRILWDAAHGRWVGVLVSGNRADAYNPVAYVDNFIWLAVSESSDPLGAWAVYGIYTGQVFPDYPGIASSGDKVVLTSNDFDQADYVGPSYYVIDWSALLGQSAVLVGYRGFSASVGATFRPAQLLSASNTVYVIYDLGGDIGFFEIRGHAASIVEANVTNLTSSIGIAGLTLPPAPRQPGGDPIADATDGRPTDAVWKDGHLWFVSTADMVDGADHWAAPRWTSISASGGTPTLDEDLIAGIPGYDIFMPGVTVTGDGTAIFVATASDATSTHPQTWMASHRYGESGVTFHLAQASDFDYAGSRWGDYLGVAADPVGTASAWVAPEVADRDGYWRTDILRIVVDGAPPTDPGPQRGALVAPATLGASSAPVKVSWSTSSDAGSGIKGYWVGFDVDNNAFEGHAAFVTSASIPKPFLFGSVYRLQVTASDAAGNRSNPTYGPYMRAALYQQTSATYSGSWSSVSSSAYSGGSVRYAKASGASATFSFSGRSVALVTSKGPTRGKFKVYVDGVYKKTISTYASSARYRQVVYAYTWSGVGSHKIKIVVAGTAGHPRVDVDAFVTLRNP